MFPTDTATGLFAVVAFGAGGSAVALFCLWLEIRGSRRASRGLVGILAILFSALAAVLWAKHRPLAMIGPFLALAGASLWVSIRYSVAAQRWAQRLLSPRMVWGLLLVICPIFSLAYAYRCSHVTNQLDFAGPDPGNRLESKELHAYTDLGREIDVFMFCDSPAASALESMLLADERLSQHVIRVADSTAASNCHGWVFTGGKCGIPSTSVDWILADNGYAMVPDAEQGDVIVYRDEYGRVLHTGLVRLAAADGLILIESKWGPLGRFIHPPESQPYGHNFAYYRSLRPNHEIRLERTEAKPTPTPAATAQ
jgi:hypothetical protein